MFLVLPHGDRMFDKYREKTNLEHHIRDFQTVTGDYDSSHADEIMKGWSKFEDFDDQRKQFEQDWSFPMWDFEARMKHNVIHYHVWTQDELIDVLKYVELKICMSLIGFQNEMIVF